MPLSSKASISAIAAAHDIADDDHIGLELELFRVIALDEFDPQRLELIRHRRIDVLIGSRDTMAGGARQRGDTAHERAADTENVNVHVSYRMNGQ